MELKTLNRWMAGFRANLFRALPILAILVAGGLFAFPAWAQQMNGGKPITAKEMRPPSDILVDCAKAPKGAVVKLPPDLARWATIYCTKFGAIFNANDRYFGVFPDSGVRASFDAAAMDGKTPETSAESYFKAIAYTPLTDDDVAQIIAVDPLAAKIINGKKTYRLTLTTNGDNNLTFVVIDPNADPFWVFPQTAAGLGSPAFFVISVTALNQARQ